MKLNKLIPLSFVALLGLAACGGGTPSTSQEPTSQDPTSQEATSQEPAVGTEITVWATAAEEEVVNAVLEEYNKNSNDADKISVKYVAVAEGDTGTEVAKDPGAASAPELFLVADDHIYNLQSKNIVVDLTDVYGEKITANNTAVSVTSSSYGGHVYGFPVTSDNGYFLWYNGDEVTAEQASTLEGLLARGRELGKQVLIDNNGWYVPTFFFAPQVCGTESLRFHEDSEGNVVYDINWDNEAGVAAAQYIADLFHEYSDVITTGGNPDIVKGFENDSMIAAASGTWMENDLKALCDGLAATTLPTYNNGKQMATFTGTKVYCLNGAKTGADAQKKLQAAARLADALTSKEAQLVRFEKRAAGPCNLEAMEDARYTEHVTMGLKALGDQCAKAAAVQATSAEGRYWDVGAAIGKALYDGELGEYANWAAFMKGECDILRAAA